MRPSHLLLAIGLAALAVAIAYGVRAGTLQGQRLVLAVAAWVLFVAALLFNVLGL